MQRLLVALFIVALVVVAALGAVTPARAESPTIAQQWCAWLNHQHQDSFVNGRWRASYYEVDLLCSRTERIEWRTDVGDDRPAYGPGTLAQWAARLGK